MSADERFDRIDESIGRLATQIAELRNDSARLTRYVLELREEAIQRFELIDQRLNVLSSTVVSLDARFPPLAKAILDFGTLAGR
jgi:hypothetical protein